jgi:hypothetical protein
MSENPSSSENFFEIIKNFILTVIALIKTNLKSEKEINVQDTTLQLNPTFTEFEGNLKLIYKISEIQGILTQLESEQEISYQLQQKIDLAKKRLEFLTILEKIEINYSIFSFKAEECKDIQHLEWFREYFNIMSFKMPNIELVTKMLSLSKKCGIEIENLKT